MPALAAPAANCPQLIQAADQQFNALGTSMNQAEAAWNDYQNTPFTTDTNNTEANRRREVGMATATAARSNLTTTATAIRALGTSDCGIAEYASKKNAFLIQVERFNTLQRSSSSVYQGTIQPFTTTLPEYQDLASNPSQGDCLGLLDLAKQQHSTAMNELTTLDAQVGSLSGTARDTAISNNTTIRNAATRLNEYIAQMRNSNCSEQIIEAQRLRDEITEKANAIEDKYNITNDSILGQAGRTVEDIGGLFSCDKCEDVKFHPLIDTFIQPFCCLLFSMVQAAQDAAHELATELAKEIQKY